MIYDPVLVDDWHPVATVEQLREQRVLGVRLLEEDIVLWQDGDETLAWQDLCIHRGTRLSLGSIVEWPTCHGQNEAQGLQCPYHGWTYNREGRCVHIPAHPEQTPPDKARVKAYQVREQYGLLWVSLGNPSHDIPAFPEWDDADFRKILCGPYQVNASGPRIIENFLDIAHFPFVHEGILGDKGRPEIADYRAEIGPDGVVAQGVQVYQPDPYGTGQGDTVSYTYRALRPLTAYLLKESAGPRFSILLMITPHAAVDSTAWMWMTMNYGHETPAAELAAWQDTIFSQDRPILESQRPELLPLDLQAELHLRSDRLALAYRTWLNQLGLSFGAA